MTTKYYCGGICDAHGTFYVEELEGELYDYSTEELETLVTPRGAYERKLLGNTPKEAVEKLIESARRRTDELEAQIEEFQTQIRIRQRELEDVRAVVEAPATFAVVKPW